MIKIGIVGGTGYTGVELLRLLAAHPEADVRAITSRKDAGTKVASMFMSLRDAGTKLRDLAFSDPADTDLKACDVVFFATPHGVAMNAARELVAGRTRIIDLAADFRIKDAAAFERWYKMPHACPELLAQAAYGLTELNRDAVRRARIVGNPGCYPTVVQLGLWPLLEEGLVDVEHLIADCKSGVSGAGRKAEMGLIFAEAADNFKAYNVNGHRHHPEIVQELGRVAHGPVSLVFIPHLVPMIRGMQATLYARLTKSDVDLQRLFERRYAGEPFVDVMPPGSAPDTRSTRAANVCRIAVHRPEGGDIAVILAVQDNLVKGAAGQAIQNMNLMFGLPETTGLTALPVLP
jgi:N-acetyl-gamma-glutamyl-phosphate reductase